MPITQDRMIRLIQSADEAMERLKECRKTIRGIREILRETVKDAKDRVLDDCEYIIQSTNIILDDDFPQDAYEAFVIEKAHFAANIKKNSRSSAYMMAVRAGIIETKRQDNPRPRQ